MRIAAFSRMRAYGRDGRLAAVLRLSLPKLCDEGDGDGNAHDAFNAFYIAISERIQRAAEKIAFPSEARDGAAPVRITADFFDVTDTVCKVRRKYASAVAVKRRITISAAGERKTLEFVDIYDVHSGVFLK